MFMLFNAEVKHFIIMWLFPDNIIIDIANIEFIRQYITF